MLGKQRSPKPSTPADAALKKVHAAGFNISQLINKLSKDRGWKRGQNLPDEVIIAVCETYLRDKEKIKKPYPWFCAVVEREGRRWGAEHSQRTAARLKTTEMPQAIKDIIAGIFNKK